jgi:acetyl esterase
MTATMFTRCLLSGFMALASLPSNATNCNDCNLPSNYKIPGKTFVINQKLSCPTNIFLDAMGIIAAEADKQVSAEEKKNNPQAVGRKAYELFGDHFAKEKPNVPVSNLSIDGSDGKHKIPLRIYEGKDSGKVVLFTHGGGWTRGNLETHDTLCRHLCQTTGATVVAVDYRLSPENPYPAGLDDASDAYKWLLEKYGKDKKVFISGDSGGGNIATALAVKLIKENGRIPDGAILFYPALDLHIPEKTMNPYATGYLLTRDSINAYVNNYTGNDPAKAEDPLVSPIMATDKELEKFPTLILVNAECDPLAEEGMAFAQRLKRLGVSVDHKVIPSTIHIFAQYFDLFPEATQAQEFVKESFKAKFGG